jgi:hypothetical protein
MLLPVPPPPFLPVILISWSITFYLFPLIVLPSFSFLYFLLALLTSNCFYLFLLVFISVLSSLSLFPALLIPLFLYCYCVVVTLYTCIRETSVRISAETPATVTDFSWISSVAPGMYRDNTSIRLLLLPFISLQVRYSSYSLTLRTLVDVSDSVLK